MTDLPSLLLGSLNPSTRKQAEQSLNDFSVQPGFLSHLLRLVLDPAQDRSVRLAGSVYLKNIVKSRWEEDVQPLVEADKASLRTELVPAMITLSNSSDKSVRVQVAEAVSQIAELDFPAKWPDLIDQLVASLSATDYNVNIGILQTSHSIFRRWRALVRSDTLYTEINLVFSKFMTPFLQLFRQTATALLNPAANPTLSTPAHLPLLAESMVLLIDVYNDFTCHDLPPDLEDSHTEFFGPQGWFPSFIAWNSQPLEQDADEATPSVVSQIKTGIFEIGELFIKLYSDQLQSSGAVKTLVNGVWSLLGSGALPNVGHDQLVSQALRFVSTAIRTGYYGDIFSAPNIVKSLVEAVVIPNVALRDHEVEQFEDDPLEYIRTDLALSSTGNDLGTRRHAAADVLQALVSTNLKQETTIIVGNFIRNGLAEYDTNKSEKWRSKDSAIFLLTAVATQGSTSQVSFKIRVHYHPHAYEAGVTATNQFIDVVQWFSENVYADLIAASNEVHPILQVDAIRFLCTFRNQLTKDQLLSVLPSLMQHVNSGNYVASTYAAIAIDRILFIKQGTQLMFNYADIQSFAQGLVDTLLAKVSSAGTPEKVAENDHLMKCVMRIIVTARHTLKPQYETTLNRLVAILGVISKNPSNPRFDQYIFESISALLRFIVAADASTLPKFEQTLFGPFTVILQQDIDQYIPYVFQVLAQMLELHKDAIPGDYRSLLPFLLTPNVWQQKGSIPGLVKLIKAFLSRDSAQMLANGQIASVLAVVQQRLIPSKQNDSWGFELLQAVVLYVAPNDLRQFFKGVVMTLLTRMHSTRTDKLVYSFTRFLLYVSALNVNGLGPDYVASTMEDIQPQLWSQVVANFILPQTPKMPHKDRKLAVIGLTRVLTQSTYMTQQPAVQYWGPSFVALAKLFNEPQYLADNQEDDPHAGITQVDYEEQTAGYQAAYSRLASSESVEIDPVAYVTNPQEFVGRQLATFAAANPAASDLIGSAGGEVQPFIQALTAAGYL